jgi:predicted transposase YbfD/YdcC
MARPGTCWRQQARAVLAQAEVDGKTNEITAFAPLLAPLDLAGAVVTADAMHAQREHAQFLVTQKHAHYILTVKNNQPSLHAQLKALPWRQVPAGSGAREKGHGRAEWRTLKVTAVAAGIAFPHAAQAIQIRRRRRLNGGTSQRWSTETSYAVTSLAASQAAPAQVAGWIRGHWGIEALHHIRDVTYGQDASQIRTGHGPQVMAALRNLGIAILKPAGHPSAAACRYHARDATRILATLGLSPP